MFRVRLHVGVDIAFGDRIETIHPTELIVAKHRNGPIGKIDLFFKSDCTKFIGLGDEEAV
ncbi:MAG: hypothetical protein IKZ43_10670 [Acidaminococcaceae bacterium]|nr:hypothetical protein [Acidaminococcaceae bacterium]